MFDYRSHALSLAAVLLALAVGIVIGVAIGDSNLVSSAKSGIVHDLSSEVSAAQRQSGQLRAQLNSEETFANDLYPIAVHRLLRGRQIGLVFLGNASDQIDGLVRSAVDFRKVDRLAKLGLGIRGHVPLSSEWPGGVLTLVGGRREQGEMP